MFSRISEVGPNRKLVPGTPRLSFGDYDLGTTVNEDVRAHKDALKNLNTQENIKKDSKRYFAERV